MGHCDGAKSILLRIEGYVCKGYEGTRETLAQKAKCGYCPCCTRPTHVLIPPAYEVGQYGRRKDKPAKLRQAFGPFASRNYAAAIYQHSYKTLTVEWNWIQATHRLSIPYPLDPAAQITTGHSPAAESSRPMASPQASPSPSSQLSQLPPTLKAPSVSPVSPSPAAGGAKAGSMAKPSPPMFGKGDLGSQKGISFEE